MTSRFVLTTIAAAALCGALPVLAQGSGADPDRNAPPEISQAPQGVPAPQGRAPRGGGRSEQQIQRGEPQVNGESHRAPRQGRPDAGRSDPARPDHVRPDVNHRGGDRRHGDRRHDHRGPDHNYGYVQPRPYYYGVPRVYYPVPRVYYSVPPTYYGYGYNGYSPAPLVFQQGDFLPPEFRQQQFVVLDWEWRGLSAPPYGYQWMLLGPDNYALVALSTGQIVSLVAAR